MSTLEDLYQRLILEHSRNPRGAGTLAGATHQARGENPLCGDQFSVALELAGDRIVAVAFQGAGCAISTASASMMTAAVVGHDRAAVAALFARVERLVHGQSAQPDDAAGLGDLSALAGVARFPVRIKCARLPWQTLMAALAGGGAAAAPVSTERE